MEGSDKISPEERERLLRGFEQWLDRALADEPPPAGLTAELLAALKNGDPLPPLESGQTDSQGCDLYSLWAAMTALTQEVRLQGRSFKQLHETILQSTQPPQAEDRQPRKQEIDVLLDLRDRIERGGATARNAAQELTPARLPLLARWLGVGRAYARQTQEILTALAQGYSLTLDTLDEALLACRVSRVAADGQLFDPRRMTAIDVEETAAVPEGTVLAVYRNGYEWNNEIYRTAQVKVARNPEKRDS
jgi:hypothetical protein